MFRALSPSALTAVAGITALVSSIKSLINTSSQIIEMSSHFEQTRKSLESLLQSADKGKALFEDLRKFSFDTTFGVDELASASSQLLNAGVATKDLRKQLKMLGDVAQGDKNRFAELTSVFAKVQLMGKAGAQTISQFNIRGVPLNKTLKEMGVVGTASAKQVTEALEKLTAEGGQFHDAMNNIIDTIEGKRGFIEDTIKEIKVNLGEVTGITDLYKSSLDAMYELYDKINNKLMEMSNSPLAKALIQGALVTGIGILVTTIGVGLVGAIKKLNAELLKTVALKSILDPKTLALALGVGALAGVTVGIISYNKNLKEAQEETKKLADETERLANGWNGGARTDKIDYAKNNLAIMETGFNKQYEDIKEIEKQINDLKKEYTQLEAKGYKSSKDYLRMGAIPKQEKELTEQLEGLRKRYIATKSIIDEQKKLVDSLQTEYDDVTQLGNLKKDFSEIFQSTMTKDEQALVEYQKQLDSVLSYKDKLLKLNGTTDNDGNIISYDKEKDNIDKTINYLNAEMAKLKMKDWQKDLQKALGLDDKETAKLIEENGEKWVSEALKLKKARKQIVDNTYTQLGIKNGDNSPEGRIKAELQEVMSIIEPLVKSGKFGAVGENGKLDNTFIGLNKELNNLKERFLNAGHSLDEWAELLGHTKEELKNFSLGDDIKNSVLSGISGTDVGDFVENLRNGGTVIGSFISVLVKDLISLVGGMDKVQYILNIIKNLLDALSPLLEAIVNIVAILGVILKPILTLLKNFLNFIFKDFNDSMDELYNSIQDETEARKSSTKSLVESYEKLGEAIKEQQEYYLKRKQELNADTYKEGVVRKVNDMILTDKGVFSTSPQDTIMAMKKPESLLGAGNTNINVKVIDNVGVNTNVRQEGNNLLIELLSQKVAVDYSDGSNGWGGAVQRQHQTSGGRSLSL